MGVGGFGRDFCVDMVELGDGVFVLDACVPQPSSTAAGQKHTRISVVIERTAVTVLHGGSFGNVERRSGMV